jgi:hypothetical protein
MRLSRPTLSTVGVTVALAALVAGVTISVEESHHRASTPKTSPAVHLPVTSLAQQTTSLAQQQQLARELRTMTVPKGVVHTTICPQAATSADACFSASSRSPVPTHRTAAGGPLSLLISLHITPTASVICTRAPGGPQGSGFLCTTNATWHGAAVSVTTFASTDAHNHTIRRGLDAIVSVHATQPS